MAEIFLPTLHWFAMNNTFSGSCGEFRFMAKPNVVMLTSKEVDFEQSTIVTEFWHGPFCYELSTMEGQGEFPMTEDGKLEMKTWLEQHI
jgi:hypothetical protein